MTERKPFNRETGDGILAFLCFASENDADTRVRSKCVAFAGNPYTSPQLYDFLEEVASEGGPSVKMRSGALISVGYVSGFVHAACNVARFYNRPEEDEMRPCPLALLDMFRRPIVDRQGKAASPP